MSDHGQALTEANGTEEAAHEAHGARFYFTTWAGLLGLTLLSLIMESVSINRTFTVIALLILTIMKATLIVANFMHVRFERLNFLMVVAIPFVFAALMYIGMWYDFVSVSQ